MTGGIEAPKFSNIVEKRALSLALAARAPTPTQRSRVASIPKDLKIPYVIGQSGYGFDLVDITQISEFEILPRWKVS